MVELLHADEYYSKKLKLDPKDPWAFALALEKKLKQFLIDHFNKNPRNAMTSVQLLKR
jgi:hypothetical protein